MDVQTTTTALDWTDCNGATGYDVYFGTQCPVPSWPDASYQHVAVSELQNVTVATAAAYCWKVVAIGADQSCVSEGPQWSFQSSACNDVVAGSPTVTSTHKVFEAIAKTGEYTLAFSEDVTLLQTDVQWTKVKGTGTLDSVTPVDGKTYTLAFSGLAPGDEYLLTFKPGVADLCGNALSPNTQVRIGVLNTALACAQAADLQDAVFPVTFPGTFPMDASVGGTCSYAAPTNAVWFSYEPTTAGWYEIAAQNSQAGGSVLAVFESDSCSPYGAQLSCSWGNGQRKTQLFLSPATRYLFLFHTDSDTVTMQAPTVSITPLSDPGLTCEEAADLSTAAFPYTVTGQFPYELWAPPSCDSTAFNMAWIKYTPLTTGWHSVTAYNGAPGATEGLRMALYETAECDPRGRELSCARGTTSIDRKFVLQSGKTYLLQLAMDADAKPLQNPIFNIAALNVGVGEECSRAIDVTSESFPFKVQGDFDDEVESVGACDTTPSNEVWFKYTASVTGWHDISVATDDTSAGTVMTSVFEGTTCAIHGPELACAGNTNVARLEKGKTYLVAAHTSSDAKKMLNPELTIKPLDTGDSCDTAIDVTGAAFPYTVSGTFDKVVGKNNCTGYSVKGALWLKYTPTTDGWYRFSSPANTSVALFDSATCNPYGRKLTCEANTSPVRLKAGTTYLLVIQSSTGPVVDPAIDIQLKALAVGEACENPMDVTGSAFPLTIQGTFATSLESPGTCGSPHNSLWLEYTPSAAGWHEFKVTNGGASSSISLAVLSGSSCNEKTSQLTCKTAYANTGSTFAELAAGTTYRVGISSSYGDPLTSPVVSITPWTFTQGDTCGSPIDLSAVTFPFQISKEFLSEPEPAAPCWTVGSNMSWFTYTPSVSGWFDLSVKTDVYTSLNVTAWEGVGCPPAGRNIGCSPKNYTGSIPVYLTAGNPITIAAGSSSTTQRNLNPTVDLKPRTFVAGQTCSTAIDVSSEYWSKTIPSTCSYEMESPPGCSTDSYNHAWFKYTPPSDGWYEVSTYYDPGIGLAVYEGDGCSPRGAELACETDGDRARSRLWMVKGQWYTILAYMLGNNSWSNANVAVHPSKPGVPGDTCLAPADTSSSNHYPGPNGEHCWHWDADNTDTAPHNGFSCDGATGGDVHIAYETAPVQTALYYTVVGQDFQADGMLVMNVDESYCGSSYGKHLMCITEPDSGVSRSGAVSVVPQTKYYLSLGDAVSGHGRPKLDVCVW